MATANLVTCLCSSCNEVLCISLNEWAEFTPSYSTYTYGDFFSIPGLDQIDQNRPGLQDSELEGCTVQALQCHQCRELIGVKCVAATSEKKQYRDRAFLKLSKMRLKSVASGQDVKPYIRPHSKGVYLSKKPTVRPRNATVQTKNSPDNRSKVKTVKRDITLLFKAIETLQRGMASVAEAIEDLKARQEEQSSLSEDPSLLTHNVTHVNPRLGEVDSLKSEMKLMQTKIARLEEERNISSSIRASTSKRPTTPHMAQMTISRPQPEKSISGQLTGSQIEPPFLKQHSEQLIDSQSIAHSTIVLSSKGPKPRYAAEAARRRSHLYQAISTLKESLGQESGATHLSAHNGADESSDATESDDEQSLDPNEDRLSDDSHNEELAQPSYRVFGSTQQDEYADETLRPRKRRRTTSSHLSPDQTSNAPESSSTPTIRRSSPRPGPTSERSSYRSIWAPEGTFRNEQGFIITRDGRVDGRSARFEGRGHCRRDGRRDEEGYLLKFDGSRDKRSVRIIDGMKKRREEREKRERETREREIRGNGDWGDEERADGEKGKLAEDVVKDAAFAGDVHSKESGAEGTGHSEAERNETNRDTTASNATNMQSHTPEADAACNAESGAVRGEVGTAISV